MLAPILLISSLAVEPSFPVEKGTTWEYVLDAGGVQGDLTQVIEASVQKPSGWELTLRNEMKFGAERATATERLLVSTGGVFRLSCPHGDFEPGLQIAGGAKDTEWRGIIDGQWGRISSTGETRVVGTTKLNVPAGAFETQESSAIYSFEINGRKSSSQCGYWFAPGVGFVRMDATLPVGRVRAELRKFTRG